MPEWRWLRRAPSTVCADHRLDAGVALVEVEGDHLRIAIDAERELRQVVRADREAVEQLGEGVDLDHVVRDLAHDVDLQAVHAALQAVLGHRLQHAFAFFDAAAERDHQLDVGQAHLVAHALHRRAFEREALGIGRVRVARGAAKADHRIRLGRLEPAPAEQARVFVGLEVRHAHDHRLRIERRGDRADAFGQLAHEVVGRASHGPRVRRAICVAHGRVVDALGMHQRHRMGLDVLGDDELHARQADAVVGQQSRSGTRCRGCRG